MSSEKKKVRAKFRSDVFERANYKCQGPDCNFESNKENAEIDLEAHHLTNREVLPFGGYCWQNGISMCSACHIKAEQFYSAGTAYPKFSPEELYKVIGSSYDEAYKASLKLKG